MLDGIQDGSRRGPLPAIARGVLSLLSLPFGIVVRLRAAGYDGGLLSPVRLPRPVVSVGNLTTGGTGKTPLVELLARRLLSLGRRPAVLSRGYGSRPNASAGVGTDAVDETILLRANLGDRAIVLAGRDRVAIGREAIALGADCLLLDDGFQHRRLARDLDILVVDCLRPFGHGRLLPRGLLREPPTAAARAHAAVLSHADLAAPGATAEIAPRLRDLGLHGPVATMELEPEALVPLSAGAMSGASEGAKASDAAQPAALHRPPDALAGEGVVLLSGIGSPRAFEGTVRRTGARVLEAIALPDHHAFGPADAARAETRAGALGARAVVTTQKDATKLAPLVRSSSLPFFELRVRARLLDGEEALLDLVCRTVATAAAEARAP